MCFPVVPTVSGFSCKGLSSSYGFQYLPDNDHGFLHQRGRGSLDSPTISTGSCERGARLFGRRLTRCFGHSWGYLSNMALAQRMPMGPTIQSAPIIPLQMAFSPDAPLLAPALSMTDAATAFVPSATHRYVFFQCFIQIFNQVAPMPPPWTVNYADALFQMKTVPRAGDSRKTKPRPFRSARPSCKSYLTAKKKPGRGRIRPGQPSWLFDC